MAFSNDLAWEIRAEGHVDNGGAFRASAVGTDYSLQDAPELIATDLEIHASVDTRIRSASRPPVNADIGNLLNVTSGAGFTVQRLQITGITSGFWDVDKSAGTISSTGGSGRLGGAITSIATALSLNPGGNWIYVRAGSGYLLGSAALTVVGGTSARPTKLIGYGTTRGDNQRVTITANDGTPIVMMNTTGSNGVIRNFVLDANDLIETALLIGLSNWVVENVRAVQWTEKGIRSTASGLIQDCESGQGIGGSGMVAATRGCFTAEANGLQFIRCRAFDSNSQGFVSSTGVTVNARDCIVHRMRQESAAGGHGWWGQGANSSAHFTNCTFYDLEGSGIFASVADAANNMVVQNCVFASIDRYGMESTSTNYATDAAEGARRRFKGNAFWSNTLGNQSLFPAGVDDITLTVDPFVDAANGDFRLNDSVGGGAELRAAGLPGAFPGLTVTGAMDVGALQAGGTGQASAGGLDTMTSLWRELTGEFSATRVPSAAVGKYLNLALEEFNRHVGYAFADDTSTTLVAGTQEYSQPGDAVEVIFVEHDGQRLEKADLDELDRRGTDWRNLPASTPTQWAHYGSKIVLIPKPDSAAVAVSNTLTVRYLRSPRDIATFGPEGLARTDYQAVVYYAVYLFSAAHPDSATAVHRMTSFLEAFNRAVVNSAEYYVRRRLARGAASELLTASGVRRSKG